MAGSPGGAPRGSVPRKPEGGSRRAERPEAKEGMQRTRWMSACLAGLGLTMVGLIGCQTQIPGTGQTLPSPRYLDYPPQYFPPSPGFPLPRELANQERAAAGAAGAGGAGAVDSLPSPVPVPTPSPLPPPVPVPAPLPPPVP
jgi:hypothetical protein